MQLHSTHKPNGNTNLLDPDVIPSWLKPPWITHKDLIHHFVHHVFMFSFFFIFHLFSICFKKKSFPFWENQIISGRVPLVKTSPSLCAKCHVGTCQWPWKASCFHLFSIFCSWDYPFPFFLFVVFLQMERKNSLIRFARLAGSNFAALSRFARLICFAGSHTPTLARVARQARFARQGHKECLRANSQSQKQYFHAVCRSRSQKQHVHRKFWAHERTTISADFGPRLPRLPRLLGS